MRIKITLLAIAAALSVAVTVADARNAVPPGQTTQGTTVGKTCGTNNCNPSPPPASAY